MGSNGSRGSWMRRPEWLWGLLVLVLSRLWAALWGTIPSSLESFEEQEVLYPESALWSPAFLLLTFNLNSFWVFCLFPPVVSTNISTSYSFCSQFVSYLDFQDGLAGFPLWEKCPAYLLGICNQAHCWLVLIVDQIRSSTINRRLKHLSFLNRVWDFVY